MHDAIFIFVIDFLQIVKNQFTNNDFYFKLKTEGGMKDQRYTIETERLLLRNYRESDIDDYYDYISSKDVGPRICFEPYTSKESALERLKLETQKPLQFAITLKGEDRVIGSIELNTPAEGRFSTIDKRLVKGAKNVGFLLSPKYWGRGIMPEAAKAVIKFAFETLNLKTLVASHVRANTQSGRVQDKVGFRVINVVENFRVWVDGKMTDSIERIMTKEDYENNAELKNFKVKITKL